MRRSVALSVHSIWGNLLGKREVRKNSVPVCFDQDVGGLKCTVQDILTVEILEALKNILQLDKILSPMPRWDDASSTRTSWRYSSGLHFFTLRYEQISPLSIHGDTRYLARDAREDTIRRITTSRLQLVIDCTPTMQLEYMLIG